MKKIKIKNCIPPIIIAIILAVLVSFSSGGFFTWGDSTQGETVTENNGSEVTESSENTEEETEAESSKAENKTENKTDIITGLANVFTIPGLALMGGAALGWIASLGTFDIFVYGTGSALGIFIKPIADKLPKTYYDYKQEKENKGRNWSIESLIVGGVMFAVGMVFVILSF